MKLLDLSSLYKYTPELLEYYHILSPEIPEFILEYSNTQEPGDVDLGEDTENTNSDNNSESEDENIPDSNADDYSIT